VTTVKFIPYTNRLAKLIKLPGGKRVEDALSDADASLKAIEAPCLTALDDLIARIRTLAAERPDAGRLEELYERSNEIVGLGGVFGMPDLSTAAYSLCDLVDRTRDRGGPDAKALAVHVDSLRLLRLGGAIAAEERQKMLEGLADVVRKAARSAG
jgi:hypothetical protein